MKFGKFVMKALIVVVSDGFSMWNKSLEKQATIMSRGTLFCRNLFQSLSNVLHLLIHITSWIRTQKKPLPDHLLSSFHGALVGVGLLWAKIF
jgi:hypothetical protein